MIRVHFADRPPQTLDVLTTLPREAIACRIPASGAMADKRLYVATRHAEAVTCGSCRRMLNRRRRGLQAEA